MPDDEEQEVIFRIGDHECAMLHPGIPLSLEDLYWFAQQGSACACCGGSGAHQAVINWFGMRMVLNRVCTHCLGTGLVRYICAN